MIKGVLKKTHVTPVNVCIGFSDSEEGDDVLETSNHLAPPPPPGSNRQRRMSIRPGAGNPARPGRGRRPSVGQGNAQVQLLSIPQLDAIQRSLKLLDVRLQHIQTNAKVEEKTRDDIDHIRRLMSENQKALSTVVTVLGGIQEEVRTLSITVHKQQQNTLTLQPPRKKSGEKGLDRENSHRSRNSDNRSTHEMDISRIWN